MPQELFKDLAQLDQVEALVLGGSRAGQHFDQDSDYDVYVYLTAPLAPEIRRSILSKHCSYMEIGNHFWELEDDCVLKNGIEMELIYRRLDDFDQDLETVVLSHQAQNAYTTCMWYNLLHSKILYDRHGRYAALQSKYSLPYPTELKKNIIAKQLLLLDQALPAFSRQIKKALKRQDLLSINHRSSEFFASYFDLLFALNTQPHPGEKRMLQYALDNCSRLPQDFEGTIQNYFRTLYQPDRQQETLASLDKILANLMELVEKDDDL
ncbi:nucleotidyltransferase domain-containing protein [Streptococcus panodentis]|uniref:Nucleotidyltransferase n=1 Tax=Streptococcus panodentis TaxID=1581472 RepID=A0ABS5AWD9_9STRE|nr:nucleotidyltransferase domain-containing protein [Streptococcus panodentis]MBP2620561.1 nucleotidyltransferase [Streptococcus panodentis]